MQRIILFSVFFSLNSLVSAQNGGTVLSGRLRTPGDQPIQQVRVQLLDPQGQILQSVTTDSSGNYRFAGLPAATYQVVPRRNGDDLNGVSTLDHVFALTYLLGSRSIGNPFELLAADVDGSGSVNVLDIQLMRRLILGVDPQFPAGESWRFLAAGLIFADPANPFAEAAAGRPATIELAAEGSYSLDFTGYKVGDINGTAFPD